jgi:hypothetical protein
MLDKRVLWRMGESGEEDGTGGLRKLHNAELHRL